MQPGSRCCMSSRFRWRKKERKKKDLKGHDISYNGISEYSSEWFVIIKGHLLVCFFCTNVSGAFFCSLLFCWCRPHVIILNTSSYVCRSVHSLSLDTCIYILKVCLNDHFDRVWSAFFCLGYTIAWVMASGNSTSRVTKTTLPSQTDIHLVLYYLEGKTFAPAPCLYLKMEEIVARPLVLGCVLQRSACLLCRWEKELGGRGEILAKRKSESGLSSSRKLTRTE